MSTSPFQNLSNLPNPGQPDGPLKLGDVIDLIHTIGGYLKDDGDWQSLTRMGTACKAYREDVKFWVEQRKKTYRHRTGEELKSMRDAELGLVEVATIAGTLDISHVSGCNLQVSPGRANNRFRSLRHLVFPALTIHNDIVNVSHTGKEESKLESLRTLSLRDYGENGGINGTYPAFFTDLKARHTKLDDILVDGTGLSRCLRSTDGDAWRSGSEALFNEVEFLAMGNWMARARAAGINGLIKHHIGRMGDIELATRFSSSGNFGAGSGLAFGLPLELYTTGLLAKLLLSTYKKLESDNLPRDRLDVEVKTYENGRNACAIIMKTLEALPQQCFALAPPGPIAAGDESSTMSVLNYTVEFRAATNQGTGLTTLFRAKGALDRTIAGACVCNTYKADLDEAFAPTPTSQASKDNKPSGH